MEINFRIQIGWKSGVLLSFALGVLGISVSRILCAYRKHDVVFFTKSK